MSIFQTISTELKYIKFAFQLVKRAGRVDNYPMETVADLIEETIKKTRDGQTKHCDKCKEYKPIKDFKDPNLRSGMGIVCVSCKGGFSKKSRKKNVSKKEFKSKDVKFKWKEGNEYNISYVNASGWASQRKVKVRSIDNKFIHTYDYQTNENRTFRKDRVKDSRLA